jgi:hypothetical protein
MSYIVHWGISAGESTKYIKIYIYIYNIYKTRSLNINAHKAGLCIDQLTVHSQEPKPVFPLGAMGSVFANSVFMVNL